MRVVGPHLVVRNIGGGAVLPVRAEEVPRHLLTAHLLDEGGGDVEHRDLRGGAREVVEDLEEVEAGQKQAYDLGDALHALPVGGSRLGRVKRGGAAKGE